ncbi:unnamed protein product [Strongylus vulgaris]|uniref:Peptidase A1 domain-containing protein n=1 Tax=Strongylus vulgaris TaxID=40348 RepID=A0A3P7IS20_STRVU|nr:unnamed protein product [Strongylus vulgaris]
MKTFDKQPIDGILGLAFPTIAVDGVTPPFFNAVEQGLVDQPIFTVFLEHVGGSPFNVNADLDQDNVYGGVYTYGGLDTTNCGPVLAYQPLSSATYYQFKVNARASTNLYSSFILILFQLDGVASNTYSSNKGWQAISDTGTSLLAAPTSIASSIAQANGATVSNSGNKIEIFFL